MNNDIDFDHDECTHPHDSRWPFKPEWEICAECGAIVRPLDFVPVFSEDYMNFVEEEAW